MEKGNLTNKLHNGNKYHVTIWVSNISGFNLKTPNHKCQYEEGKTTTLSF